MPEMTVLLTYLAVLVGFVFFPGPSILLTLARASTSGTRAGVATSLGIGLGDVIHTLLAVIGVSAIVMASANAFLAVKLLGAGYLIYIGLRSIFERTSFQGQPDLPLITPRKAFRQACLAEVLNPKSAMFFLAFLPQFVPANVASPTAALSVLAFAFMAITFVVFLMYGACAALARDYVISRPKVMLWLRRTFAGAFGLLGLKLALSEK